MEIYLIKGVQLLLSLTILVALHEGGHFFFSKLFGVRVEKFFLFFDPYFHIISTRDNWLGMIDESMDTEQLKQPEQPWEFRSKPAWQRLLIMVGGVLVNFLLAFFIYAMVLYAWGTDYVPVQNYSQGMAFNERAKEIGFQDGDILLRTEKGEIKTRSTGDTYRLISEADQVTVNRKGQEVTIQMPGELSLLDMINEVPIFMDALVANEVDSVVAGMPGAMAGLQKGDQITCINGTMISSLSILMTKEFKIGFMPLMPEVKAVHEDYGFFESFPAGVSYGWNVLGGYVSDLKYLFTKQGAKSVGGFGSIGSIFPDKWDWHRFWLMTAFLSIILGFMNILPIPALDGGHVLFLLYEVVTRRKPNEKFLEYAQMVGMALLLLLMIWANLNDIIRFLF